VLMTAEASIATTDALLLAAILGAQGVLMRIYRAAKEGDVVSTRMAMWGWASFAIAILVKGPVGAGVTGGTVVALLAWDWWNSRPRREAIAEPQGDAGASLAPSEPVAPSSPRENIFLW